MMEVHKAITVYPNVRGYYKRAVNSFRMSLKSFEDLRFFILISWFPLLLPRVYWTQIAGHYRALNTAARI